MFIRTGVRIIFVFAGVLFGINAKDEPQFIGESSNVTVVVGRDATLVCKVNNLFKYKVAWLRVDTQTILTIGPHVITKNPRVSVARGDGLSWTLSLKETRPSDGGRYMCQLNTEPMITQTHHLDVVVPPDIVDAASSGEIMVKEGDNVSLHCAASGTPQPTIMWRREDLSQFRINGQLVSKWSGVWLNMSQVERDLNGAFLCIATNGVPPSVSKRIMLHVLCGPTVVPAQTMIGGFLGETVTLQCHIEANPKPSTYWTHSNVNRLQNGSKYQLSVKSNGYRHTSNLRVLNITRRDIGLYQCNAENTLGNSKVDITIYTIATTTSSTTAAPSTTSSTTLSTTVETTAPYAELEEALPEENNIETEDYVVVLSQHQMQNLDLSPSS